MERLLADAEKLSGQKFDLSSYGDIVDAIHVVQTEMGITGTTAKEAATTIQGSIGMMKAAWVNLTTGMADPSQDFSVLMKNMVDSTVTVFQNLAPRIIETIPMVVQGISMMITGLIPQIIPLMQQLIPTVLQGAAQIVQQLFTAFSSGITTGLPQMMNKGAELIGKLAEGIQTGLPALISNGLDILMNLSTTLNQNAPQLIQSGLNMIVSIAQGLMNSLPELIAKVPTIVSNIANIINDNAPKLLVTAGKLIFVLGKGLIQAIPTLVANIPKIIKAIVDVFMAFQWSKLGKDAVTKIKDAFVGENGAVKVAAGKIKDTIVNAIKELPAKLYNLAKSAISKLVSILKHTATVKSAASAIKNEIVRVLAQLPAKMLDIGLNLVKGLWSGIKNAKNWVLEKVKGFGSDILDGLKNIFGIHSPATTTEWQGDMLAEGLVKSFKKNKKYVGKSAAEMAQVILDAAQKRLEKYKTYNEMSLADEVRYWNRIRKECKKGTDGRLQADQQYLSAKKQLNEQLKAAEDDYLKKVEEVQQKVVDRTKAILQQFNLFEEFKINIDPENPITGTGLIDNLQSQVDALTQWDEQMDILKDRLGETDLFKSVQEMGIASMEQVKAINRMTDEQLKKYEELYNKRAEQAKQQAEDELAKENAETLANAYVEWQDKVAELGGQIKTTNKEAVKSVAETTKQVKQKLDTAIKDTKVTLTNGLAEAVKITETKFSGILSVIQSKMSAAVSSVRSAVNSMLAELAKVDAARAASSETTTTTTTTSKVAKHAAGGILTEPTIFGYSPKSGTYHLGGEAGAEAVAPIDVLQKYVRQAVAEANGDNNANLLMKVIELLQAILKATGNSKIEIDGREFGRMVKSYA